MHIHPSATLENVVVGPYATIAAGCDIRDSIIKNSIVDDGAQVHKIILDDSLIGRDARVTGRYFTLNVGDASSVDFS